MIFNSSGGSALPDLSNPGVAEDLRNGKQLINGDGKVVTGIMPDIAVQTPSITVNQNGQITATVTHEEAGYVAMGAKSATKNLSSADDPDFVASNIVSGVTIFGVAGSAKTLSNSIVTINNDTSETIESFSTASFRFGFTEVENTTRDNDENAITCLTGGSVLCYIPNIRDCTISVTGDVQKIYEDGSNDHAFFMVKGDGTIRVY